MIGQQRAEFTITVHGRPAPQGSKTKGRWGNLIDDNGAALHPWRDAVRSSAVLMRAAHPLPGAFPLQGPIQVRVRFWLPMPSSAPKRIRTWPIKQRSGDLDKLQRAVLDALTDAGVWVDDAQVVAIHAVKDFCCPAFPTPGAEITFGPLNGGGPP